MSTRNGRTDPGADGDASCYEFWVPGQGKDHEPHDWEYTQDWGGHVISYYHCPGRVGVFPDRTVEDPQITVGSRVKKKTGYAFDSMVVAVFENLAGDTRLVCESILIPGMLHIFSPQQMELE